MPWQPVAARAGKAAARPAKAARPACTWRWRAPTGRASSCSETGPSAMKGSQPTTALVLSGNGAHAAYQVAVLQALTAMRKQHLGPQHATHNPFGVIVGT